MFIGFGITFIGPKTRQGKPISKCYCVLGASLTWPKWMLPKKNPNCQPAEASESTAELIYADNGVDENKGKAEVNELTPELIQAKDSISKEKQGKETWVIEMMNSFREDDFSVANVTQQYQEYRKGMRSQKGSKGRDAKITAAHKQEVQAVQGVDQFYNCKKRNGWQKLGSSSSSFEGSLLELKD